MDEKTCPAFERCGSCQLLDLPYNRQLLIKQSKVKRLLPRCRRNSDCCQGGAGRQSSISDDEHASICFAAGNGGGAAAPMKHIVRLLLALIFCRCVVLFPVQAQVIDPAAEVEQYFAGEDMTAVKDAIPPEVAEQMEQQGISSFSKLISMPVRKPDSTKSLAKLLVT